MSLNEIMEGIEKKIESIEPKPDIQQTGLSLEKDTIIEEAEQNYEYDIRSLTVSIEDAQRIADAIEAFPEYQEYKKQRVHLDTLQSIVEDFSSQAQRRDEEDKLAEYAINMLKTALWNIKSNLDGYYAIIRRIETLKNIQQFRMGQEDFIKLVGDSDIRRRNIHNSIITNLKLIARFVHETAPDKFGVVISPEKVLSQGDLSNRYRVAEWAYNTALGMRLEKYRDKLKEIAGSKSVSK